MARHVLNFLDVLRQIVAPTLVLVLTTACVAAIAQEAEPALLAPSEEVLGDPNAVPGLTEDSLQYPLIVPVPPAPSVSPPLPTASSGSSAHSVTDELLALVGEDGGALASLPTTIAGGRTPATFAVSNAGAASYTIPLWSPPGVGEVQLKLALIYNSRGQNGVVGMGWSVSGLSAITRCNKTWAQDGGPSGVTNTLPDRFCLDGQQLKLVSGTYGQAGSVYATEIESFSKLVANGPQTGNGPASFTVTTKNGLVYEYGATTDSKIFAGTSGTIRTWALSRIRDRAQGSSGNYISVAYTNEAQNGNYTNGSYRVASITFPTTATGQGPFYEVLFTYAARPSNDTPSGYLAGSMVREPNLLTTITMREYGSGTLIKTYSLAYNQGSASNRSRLASLQECSSVNCFRPTTFSYQAGSTGWESTIRLTGVNSSSASGVGPIQVDLNADGLTDILYPVVATSSTSRWWAILATTSGYGSGVDTGITTANSSTRLAGAFSGTDRQQLLMEQSGYWYVVSYTGSSFTSVNTGLAVNGEFRTVDYDGDSLPDLASIVGGSVKVRRNTTVPPGAVTFAATAETVWSATGTLTLSTGSATLTSMADFDADGRGDLSVASYINTGFGTIVYWNVLRSNGFGTPATWTQLLGNGGFAPLAGDWNADGCTDLISGYKIYVSNCAGAFATLNPSGPVSTGATMAGDWDGDGRVDLLYTNVSNNTWYVQRSTGEGIASAVSTGIAAPTSTGWFVLEQDGDGLVDLGFVDGNAGYAIKYRWHNGRTVPADLATSFTDGFGINQSPTYKTISRSNYTKYANAAFPEQDFQGPLYVVDQFTASDGTGSTYQNQFWYYGARLHLQGRGFEGFDAQRIFDTRSLLYTYDYLERTFPYTGMLIQRRVVQQNGTTSIGEWAGAKDQQVSGGTGYERRYFPFIVSSTDKRWEYLGALNGTLVTQTDATYTYGDGFGNLTQEQQSVTDKDPTSPFFNTTWQTTTTKTYANDSADNCFGLPQTAGVTKVVPGQTTRTRSYSFDVDTSACRVWRQVIEPSIPALKVTTTLGFDDCGNVNSVQIVGSNSNGTPMPARTTSFGFGTRCQLPESVTNALTQTTSLAYRYDFGVPTLVTDPNLIATGFQYDDFGRKTLETRPDGTSTTWSFESCSAGPCWGVNDLRFKVFETPRDTAGVAIRERWLFYDGLERFRFDAYKRVFGTWTYESFYVDSLGRRTIQYLPYSSGINGYATWTYDALNRVTAQRLYQASGALDRTTTVSYAGRSTTITDPLLRARTQVADVTGSLRRATDPSPGGTTKYDFDAFGNLNRMEDPIGAISSGSYNLRGFREQWADADRGTWNFSANSLNELVSWTDAKGQSFSAIYDPLGRMTSRTEPEGTSTWTWGNSQPSHNIGALASLSGYGYAESRSYDSIGRLNTRVITTDQTYQYDYGYNSIGTLDTLTYPTSPIPAGQTGSRFKIQYAYSYGAPYEIRDVTGASPVTLWTLNTANDYQSPTTETLATVPTSTSVTNGYKAWTNELTSIQSGVGLGLQTNRQNLAYQWDTVGNLTQRQDLNQSVTEVFTPDALDRVLSSTLNGVPNLTMTYHAAGAGNIQSKSDIGTYIYNDSAHPHAVTAAGTGPSSYTFTYDANGNAITRNGLTQTWASFNLPIVLQATVNGSTWQSQLWYGPEHRRWKQVATYSNGIETTFYVGGLLEKESTTSTGLTYWHHHVPTPSGLTIIVTRYSDLTSRITLALSDHLGSADAMLDGTGNLVVQESFDAFGARRGSNWTNAPPGWVGIAETTRHGFTWHEHLDNINLIHMNGRVYDPAVGRFLSVDPLIGDLTDSQSVNPYAYVGNRPLSFTDSSGYGPDDSPGQPRGGPWYDWNYDGPGSWDWWGRQFDDLGNLWGLLDSSPPPPPPATSLPGISAQNGTSLCGPGTNSPTCRGIVLYDQTPAGADGAGEYKGLPDEGLETVCWPFCQVWDPVDAAAHGEYAEAVIQVLPTRAWSVAKKVWKARRPADRPATATPAAKSTEEAVADVVRSRRPSAAVRQQADQASTDATGKLRCQYCGKEIQPKAGSPTSREYDHVNPYSRGGTSDIGNIKDACRTCNRSKGAQTPEEWGGPQQ